MTTNPDVPVPASQSMQDLERYAQLFLRRYALRTQVKPGKEEHIVAGLYEGVSDARRLRRNQMPTAGLAALDDIVRNCLEKLGFGLVLRGKNGNQSLVMRSQMPAAAAGIPTGGVMDLPLDAYLRSCGVAGNFAKRVHNVLVRQLPDTRPFCMRLATGRQHVFETGFGYSSVLSTGGLVAYLREHSLEELRQGRNKIGPRTIEVLTEHVIPLIAPSVSQDYGS